MTGNLFLNNPIEMRIKETKHLHGKLDCAKLTGKKTYNDEA